MHLSLHKDLGSINTLEILQYGNNAISLSTSVLDSEIHRKINALCEDLTTRIKSSYTADVYNGDKKIPEDESSGLDDQSSTKLAFFIIDKTADLEGLIETRINGEEMICHEMAAYLYNKISNCANMEKLTDNMRIVRFCGHSFIYVDHRGRDEWNFDKESIIIDPWLFYIRGAEKCFIGSGEEYKKQWENINININKNKDEQIMNNLTPDHFRETAESRKPEDDFYTKIRAAHLR